MDRRIIVLLASIALTPAAALGQESPIRIGVMNDLSGPYSDFQGIGSVIAAQMAIEDFGKAGGRKLAVVSADHQNKPMSAAPSPANGWIPKASA